MKLLTSKQLDLTQIVGPWACEPSFLASYVEQFRSLDLSALEAAVRSVFDPEKPWDAPLYELTDTGVAIVSVSGPLTKRPNWLQRYYGGTATVQTRKAIDAALRDPAVYAILVVADTPGGMHAGTSELASTIRHAATIKPTWTYAEDMACSAGLWSIAAGARVFANSAAVLGSIGTYMVVWDQSGMYSAAGIKVHVISSAPPIKGSGVAGSEVVPEQLAAWKKTVGEMSSLFVSALADLRGLGLEDVRALATGDVWSAEETLSHGLIDGVASLADVTDAIRKEKSPMSKTTSVPTAASTTTPESTAPATAPAAAATEPTPTAATAPAASSAPVPAPAAVTVTAEELAALRARADRAEADAAAARASAATLEQAERSRRFAGHATRLGLPAAMAGVLDRIEATMGAEVFSALDTAFSAKRVQAANPGQFNEAGTAEPPAPAASEGGAMAQLKAIADQLVADKKAPNYASAILMAAQQNPGLAAQTRPSGT